MTHTASINHYDDTQSNGLPVCSCGRAFPQRSALTKHMQSCQASRKQLSNALETAKQLRKNTKRRRLQMNIPLEASDRLPPVGLLPQLSNPMEGLDSQVCIQLGWYC